MRAFGNPRNNSHEHSTHNKTSVSPFLLILKQPRAEDVLQVFTTIKILAAQLYLICSEGFAEHSTVSNCNSDEHGSEKVMNFNDF